MGNPVRVQRENKDGGPSGKTDASTSGGASDSTASVKPARADARRNRERLLAAASATFAAAEDDSAPLEAIAREAGVGIGTLYRHFPTREALVEAVYAAELDDVVASAATLLDELPPEDALRAWMRRYAAFIATKRGMFDTLRAGWAAAGNPAPPTTRERITGAVATLLDAGARAGSLRADVEPEDVVAMLLGAFFSTAAGGTQQRTARLLDLILDAVRPRDGPDV